MRMNALEARVAEELRIAEGSLVFDGLQARLSGVSREELRASLDRLVALRIVHHQPLGARGIYRYITDDLRHRVAPPTVEFTTPEQRRTAIEQLLRQSPPPRNADICRRLGISKTTLQRDLDTLRAAGLPDRRPLSVRRPRTDDTQRDKILALIQDAPGLTIAQLSQRANLPTDTIGPALTRLSRAGLIERIGRYRAQWYPTGTGARQDAATLATKLATLDKLGQIVCPSIATVLLEISRDLKRSAPVQAASSSTQ